MPLTTADSAVSKPALWTGRVLSALVLLMFVGGGIFILLKPAMAAQGFSKYGYPSGALPAIAIVEVVCGIVYAIPRTAMFGAILLTGYLGGATATHVRAGEPFFLPVVVGIVVWLGLYLRDAKLRALVPMRK